MKRFAFVRALCLICVSAALFSVADTWQDDFSSGTPGNTEVISDSVQMAMKSDWWDPAENWWNPLQNWWDPSYQYRKAVNINNTGSPLSDYQVKVENPIYNETGLKGSWHFEEGAGTATADSSGSMLNGTITIGSSGSQGTISTAWTNGVSGKFGSSMSFDGTDDYVTIPNVDKNTLTFCAWVKRGRISAPANTDRLIASVSNGGWAVAFDSPQNRLFLSWVGTDAAYSTGTITDTTNWHFIVVTYNGSLASFYIDGAFDSAASYNRVFNSSGSNYTIGSRTASTEPFMGLIDEIRIYERMLSINEIQALYQAKAKLNYGDVRFVNSAGTAEYPYFMQKDGTFYVKFPSSAPLEAGLNSICMYYGNASAASTSNFSSTMNENYSYESGLVSQYLFNEGSGSAAGDSKGTNNGVLNNMEPADWTSGRYNNYALEFDGTNEYVNLPSITGVDTTTPNTKTTVEFWMYWTGTDDKMPFGWNQYDLYLRSGYFGFNTAAGDVYGISSTGMANKWVHVVAIFNNGSVTSNSLYINGVSQVLSQLLGSPLSRNVSSSANISGWTSDTGYKIGGRIDDVRIYNRALTADEASAHYQYRKSVSPEPSVYTGSETVSTSSWPYRKAVVLNNTNASALSDYQVKIERPVYSETGLAGSWHFEDGTGTSIADSSGNPNTGTLSAGPSGTQVFAPAAWANGASGKSGAALNFDGTDDYASLPMSFPTPNFTIEAHFKLNSTTQQSQTIFGGNADFRFGIVYNYTGNGKLLLDLSSTGSSWNIANNNLGIKTSWQAGQWYYLVLRFDGTYYKVFIDNVEDISVTSSTALFSSPALWVGKWGNSQFFLNGLVDEVRLYSCALSADEIKAHYDAKAKLNYGDLRFINSGGTVEFPYWMEKDGTFWVRANDIPAGLSNIYAYYGNTSAASTASVSATFLREISNLQGAWQFEETAGTYTGTTADASGQNRNGTLSSFTAGNGIVTSGKFSNGVKFNGSSGSVDLGTWFNYQSFTIAMWVSAGATQVQYADLIDNNHTNTNWVIEQNSTSTNQYYWGVTDGMTGIPINLTANAWTHLVMTREQVSRLNAVYFNNSPAYATGTGAAGYGNPINVTLGRWWSGGRNWNGLMDSVFMFDKALSAVEVSDLYNNCGFATRTYPGKLLIRKYTPVEPAVASIGSEVVSTFQWQYRKPVTITNSGSALSDYQIKAVNPVYDETGLAGSWHFDGATSGMIANSTTFGMQDSSGNNRNGTASNATGGGMQWSAGRFDGAVSFDGMDDYVSVPHSSSWDFGTGNFTVEFWVKSGDNSVEVLTHRKGTSPYNGWYISFSAGGNSPLAFYTNTNTLVLTTNSNINDNSWHHCVFTRDGSAMSWYIDGAPNNSTVAVNVESYTVPLYFGGIAEGFNNYMAGSLDEISIYGRALSADEIASRYAAKMKLNYGDIRFTGSSGTEFPYWMEKDGTFWIKVLGNDSLPAGDTIVNMYYGNSSATGAGNSSQFLKSNIISYYALDESSGNAIDKCGKYNGTSTGIAYSQTGKINTSYGFGGDGDKVDFGQQAEFDFGNGNFSFSFWVYPTEAVGAFEYFFGYVQNDSAGPYLFGRTTSGYLRILMAHPTTWDTLVDTSLYLPTNSWSHIVIVRNGTNVYPYVNNTASSTIPNVDTLSTTYATRTLKIGTYGGGEFYQGSIDELGIWNKALTADEISQLYGNGNGRILYAPTEPVVSAGSEQSIFQQTGTFTSAAKDTLADNTAIDSVAWAQTGSGTITLEVRAGNTDTASWTSSSPAWETVDNGDTSVASTGRYLQYKASFTGTGQSAEPVLTDVIITYTIPIISPEDSVLCDKFNSTWYSTAVFTFTNDVGFGADIDRYYYAWDNTSSHIFTLGESVWDISTPQLQNSATADGIWYFHYLPYSSTDTPGTAQDMGPYYYDGTAPAVPVLILPENNGSVSNSVTSFTWEPVDDASGVFYTFQLDYYTFFGSPIVNNSGLLTQSYTLTGAGDEILIGNKTYYWRVTAVDGAGNSAISAYMKFNTTSAIPQIINTMTGESYSSVQDALDSTVTVDGDVIRVQDTVSHDENVTITKNITLENAILAPSSGFAVTGQGTSGGEILRNCVITSGGVSDLALGENLTIYNPSPTAVATIQNSKLVNCLIESGTIIINSTLENCYAEATADYFVDASGGDFHLSNTAVNAIDRGKNLGAEFTVDIEESERGTDILDIANFDAAAWDIGAYEMKIETGYVNLPQAPSVPAGYYPADGTENLGTDIVLVWYPSTGSDPIEYAIQVSTSADMTNPYYTAADIADTFKEISGLSYETVYYWQVKALNDAGESDWSAIYDFTTQAEGGTLLPGDTPGALTVPELSYPGDNGSGLGSNVIFVWYPSTGTAPITYSLELAMAEDMSLTLYAIDDIENEFLQISSLPYNTVFYWRVKAVNTAGESAWSGIWQFSTAYEDAGGVNTMLTIPDLLAPDNDDELTDLPVTFLWQAVSGSGITYEFQASTDANFAVLTADYTNITGNTLVPSSVFSYNVNYYWRVRAHDDGGYSDWSSVRSFTVTKTSYTPAYPPAGYGGTSGGGTSGLTSEETVRQKGGCFIKALWAKGERFKN